MRYLITGVLCWSFAGQALAASDSLALDIKGTSLLELMNLKITSLSRKEESVSQAPAAVTVITGDIIQRMGVTHIAEVLRYVPGVEVARLTTGRWAISVRGFNSQFANKLQVMIDGRSVYSPLFSGVLWELQDVLLTDVDRIEVIRGPGGTQWGANAVNGVINIITKSAEETQGGVATLGGGREERKLAQSRYGFQVGERTYARVYGKYTQRADSGAGAFGEDRERVRQAGFRMDHRFLEYGDFTLQGDIFDGHQGQQPFEQMVTANAEEFSGGNLLLNWDYQATRDREHQVKLYFDRTQFDTFFVTDRRDTWNLDYQLQQRWRNHEIVGGLGYRFLSDDEKNTQLVALIPPARTDELRSAFVQDDIAFLDKRLHLILGAKYELNDYSNEEWQPSVRTSYQFDKSLLWVAWSRATRTPTRLETDVVLPRGNGGNARLRPEQASIYELGWRKAWKEIWQLDLAAYLADYDDVVSREQPTLMNSLFGDIKGIEATLSVQPARHWMLKLSASHAIIHLDADANSAGVLNALTAEGSMPKNTLSAMSFWDINEYWQLNTFLRYVDELPAFANVPDYWAGDVSLVWKPLPQTTLQLVGHQLGDGEHYEWGGNTNPVEPDWALYLTQQF